MENKVYDKKRLKKASLALAIIFALMLLFTILSWGTASGWGDVRIYRVNYVSEGGANASGLMFVPKNVNNTNPAPAIINFHGRNCSSYSMINWAIEEARRGYVVLNPDLSGTNETENTAYNTTANLAKSAYEYLNALNMVTDISVTGHSMGNVSLNVLMRDPEIQPELNAIVGVGGFFFWKILPGEFPTETNYYIVEGTADLYTEQWFGDRSNMYALLHEKSPMGESLEYGTLYGDPQNGNAFEFLELPITHQQMMYNDDTIAAILDFVGMTSPAPVEISTSSMVYHTFQHLSAICCILFLFFVGALAYTLTSLPLFYSTLNAPLAFSNGKSAKKWVIQFLTDYLIPIALFVPVTKWAAKLPTKIFCSEWVNQIFFWITSVAIVGAVMIAIRYVKKSKQTKLTALDFGTGTADEKILNGRRILNAFAVTLITVFVAFTWLDWVIKIFGINYQCYCLLGQFNRPTPERIRYAIPYLIVCIFLVFVINVNIATTRRMKTTGNETRDMVRDIFVNILLSAGPLSLLMAVEFFGVRIIGNGVQPFNSAYWGSLSFGFMFPLMMSASAGLSTFLYKKTGNIWTGVFTSSFTLIFITIFNCCATAIVLPK